MADFLTDIRKIRERARAEIDKGPITGAYRADLSRVIQVCNEALATEIVCVLRYRRHHADRIARRIVQLGGESDFDPDTLSGRAHSEYVNGDDLISMINEDLVAERVAIAAYTEIVQWLGDQDVTTRRMFEEILAKEEEHADDMKSLLNRLPAILPG